MKNQKSKTKLKNKIKNHQKLSQNQKSSKKMKKEDHWFLVKQSNSDSLHAAIPALIVCQDLLTHTLATPLLYRATGVTVHPRSIDGVSRRQVTGQAFVPARSVFPVSTSNPQRRKTRGCENQMTQAQIHARTHACIAAVRHDLIRSRTVFLQVGAGETFPSTRIGSKPKAIKVSDVNSNLSSKTPRTCRAKRSKVIKTSSASNQGPKSIAKPTRELNHCRKKKQAITVAIFDHFLMCDELSPPSFASPSNTKDKDCRSITVNPIDTVNSIKYVNSQDPHYSMNQADWRTATMLAVVDMPQSVNHRDFNRLHYVLVYVLHCLNRERQSHDIACSIIFTTLTVALAASDSASSQP